MRNRGQPNTEPLKKEVPQVEKQKDFKALKDEVLYGKYQRPVIFATLCILASATLLIGIVLTTQDIDIVSSMFNNWSWTRVGLFTVLLIIVAGSFVTDALLHTKQKIERSTIIMALAKLHKEEYAKFKPENVGEQIVNLNNSNIKIEKKIAKQNAIQELKYKQMGRSKSSKKFIKYQKEIDAINKGDIISKINYKSIKHGNLKYGSSKSKSNTIDSTDTKDNYTRDAIAIIWFKQMIGKPFLAGFGVLGFFFIFRGVDWGATLVTLLITILLIILGYIMRVRKTYKHYPQELSLVLETKITIIKQVLEMSSEIIEEKEIDNQKST